MEVCMCEIRKVVKEVKKKIKYFLRESFYIQNRRVRRRNVRAGGRKKKIGEGTPVG